MSRRFQFSLRGLLGLAAVICFLFGGWHLLRVRGQYAKAVVLYGDTDDDPAVCLQGRLFWLSVEPSCGYDLEIYQLSRLLPVYHTRLKTSAGSIHGGAAERSWPLCYRINEDLGALPAGDYEFTLTPESGPPIHGTFAVAEP